MPKAFVELLANQFTSQHLQQSCSSHWQELALEFSEAIQDLLQKETLSLLSLHQNKLEIRELAGMKMRTFLSYFDLLNYDLAPCDVHPPSLRAISLDFRMVIGARRASDEVQRIISRGRPDLIGWLGLLLLL